MVPSVYTTADRLSNAQMDLAPLIQRMQDFIPTFSTRLANLAKHQPSNAEDFQVQIILALRGYADQQDMLIQLVITLLRTVEEPVSFIFASNKT